MAAADDLPVRSRLVSTGTLNLDSVKHDAKSAPTEENTGATLGPDDKSNEPDGHADNNLSGILLENDPFSSESSRVLFNGIDQLRKYGNDVGLELPQLVIVGAQSAGKSTLLKTLTGVPFPVGDLLCTRFSTRVISQRSAPGTADIITISIEKGESKSFDGQQAETEEFKPSVQSITAAVFKDIFEQASVHMGLTGGRKSKRSNFSTDILEIKLQGPNRSQFGILDVPGIFQAKTTTVTDTDMKRVKAMVVSYMKQTANIIICVAPASEDLANQQIFHLADQHVTDKSRVVGVITKCDDARRPQNIVDIVRDNMTIKLENDWFVVRNLPDDAPPTSDQEEEEKATFGREPWLNIPARQRGTAALKEFLAYTLFSRIHKAFPVVLDELQNMLATENTELDRLGREGRPKEKRRQYLQNVIRQYHELARDALKNPAELTNDDMKLRGFTQKASDKFARDIESKGVCYNFVDFSVNFNDVTAGESPLYKRIRHQIRENRGEELAVMTNPAVLKPLFNEQTSKWKSFGQEYLNNVVKKSEEVALKIFDYVALEFKITNHTSRELKNKIHEVVAEAKEKAALKLRQFCKNNSESLLATTDKSFEHKIEESRKLRFMAAMVDYRNKNPAANFLRDAFTNEQLQQAPILRDGAQEWVIINEATFGKFFEHIHPRAARNAENEIHDILKSYYEVALEYFKNYVLHEIVEEFLQATNGVKAGLFDEYISSLEEDDFAILGGEDETVIRDRNKTMKRIKQLEEALKIAHDAWVKSEQAENL